MMSFDTPPKRSIVAPLLCVFALAACRNHPPDAQGAKTEDAPKRPANAPIPKMSEVIFQGAKGGRAEAWQDWGWATHADTPNGPARIEMAGWKGWQLVHPAGVLPAKYGGLLFRYRAPDSFGDFLVVHAGDPGGSKFADIAVSAYQKPGKDGFHDVFIPIEVLAPGGAQIDRVVFFVNKDIPKGWVELDDIGLAEGPDPATLPPPAVRPLRAKVDCSAQGTPISPLIYGIAVDFQHNAKDAHQWALGATARRWGGNSSTRYNWQLGSAWNTAADWFFENVRYTGNVQWTYREFLQEDMAHHVESALTIPILGWVAKDITSSGFPKSQFPDQAAFDGYRPEAGNGKGKDQKLLTPGSPTLTSMAATPAFYRAWIEAIVAEDKKRGSRSVRQYILDNEPALWSETHRDVHPEPLSYDELLAKTLAVGDAIRAADPDAVIAGPAEWGWTNYFYSKKDLETGTTFRMDRRSHGDQPLIAWYLQKLAEHEKATGSRVLDVLDLHFYPQGDKVYSPAVDQATVQRRLRQTRGLWDKDYVDESWIKEAVMLIPRMKAWVAENYPGRGISIGEWNFGGEAHWSGGIATAEALGRFGQYGVTSAFYWTYPADKTPAFWAFRAFRDFDGKGAHFESISVPVTGGAEGLSVFASRSDDKHRVVLVLLNATEAVASATVDVDTCGKESGRKVYVYAGGQDGFVPATEAHVPPHGMAVVDLTFP